VVHFITVFGGASSVVPSIRAMSETEAGQAVQAGQRGRMETAGNVIGCERTKKETCLAAKVAPIWLLYFAEQIEQDFYVVSSIPHHDRRLP